MRVSALTFNVSQFTSGQVSSDTNWLTEMTGGSYSLMNTNKGNMVRLVCMQVVISGLII